MKYNTAGQLIYEPIQNCDCGLTGGCEKCHPWVFCISQINGFIGMLDDEEAKEMKKKLIDYKKRFNEDFERKNKILFPSNS